MSEKQMSTFAYALLENYEVYGNTEDEEELCTRDNLIEYIAELEAAQRWIPVSKPPKVSGKYLLLNIYDDVYPCDFIAGTEIWVLPDYDTVTHWMPLPESPNGTQSSTIVYGKESE